MYVLTGITGKVGSAAAATLLAKGLPVRAVVRSREKGAYWERQGCDLAVVPDAGAHAELALAFRDAAGVFLMVPPDYDPEPGFPLLHEIADAYRRAIEHSKPGKVVLLSTIGAQAERFNLLNWGGIFEDMLASTAVPSAALRSAWFMENAAWDLPAARAGRISSYLMPLDRAIDMVSVRDVGRVAAELLEEGWSNSKVVELSGPCSYSPNDEAAGFGRALGRSVEAVEVPRDSWDTTFRSEGMRHPEARMRMLDGFNEGWITFEKNGIEQRMGRVSFDTVLRAITASGR